MANHSSRPRSRASRATQALQKFQMRQRFPGFSCHQKGEVIVWRGELQPRFSSPIYRIEVRCEKLSAPSVKVLSPPLATNPPHVYNDGSLCLYWPMEWQWSGKEIVALTILPWTALWLQLYELWLDTGEWLGSSSHGALIPKAEDERAA